MKRGKMLVLPSMVWLGLFFALPLLIVVGVSFASRTAYGQVVFQWTLENYARFLEPLYLTIFVSTLATALITTLFTFAMGYPVAYTIAMVLPKKWQQAGIILVMIPFWINFLIRSYSWVIILRAQGLVNTFLLHLGVIQVPMSLQEPVYNDGGDALYVMDQISDTKNKEERWVENLSLEAAMGHLNPRERHIIKLRFFEAKTQMEVAEEIKISQAQVSRLEKNALRIMRQYLS